MLHVARRRQRATAVIERLPRTVVVRVPVAAPTTGGPRRLPIAIVPKIHLHVATAVVSAGIAEVAASLLSIATPLLLRRLAMLRLLRPRAISHSLLFLDHCAENLVFEPDAIQFPQRLPHVRVAVEVSNPDLERLVSASGPAMTRIGVIRRPRKSQSVIERRCARESP